MIMHPITELRRFIANSQQIATTKGFWHELLGWDAAAEIAADIKTHEDKQSRSAYSAAIEDEEAVKLLEEAAKDGLSQCDMPAVAKAIRNIRRSAERDRKISEAATV